MEITGEPKGLLAEIVGIMKSGEKHSKSGFKKVDRRKLGHLVIKSNDVLTDMKTTSIAETNIINVTTTFITKKLSLRSGGNRQKKRDEPW